jgi:hypothetical protein
MPRRLLVSVLAVLLALGFPPSVAHGDPPAGTDAWPWPRVCLDVPIKTFRMTVNETTTFLTLTGSADLCPGIDPDDVSKEELAETRIGLAYYERRPWWSNRRVGYVAGTAVPFAMEDPANITVTLGADNPAFWSSISAVCIVAGLDNGSRLSCLAVNLDVDGGTVRRIPPNHPRVNFPILLRTVMGPMPFCGSCV